MPCFFIYIILEDPISAVYEKCFCGDGLQNVTLRQNKVKRPDVNMIVTEFCPEKRSEVANFSSISTLEE